MKNSVSLTLRATLAVSNSVVVVRHHIANGLMLLLQPKSRSLCHQQADMGGLCTYIKSYSTYRCQRLGSKRSKKYLLANLEAAFNCTAA